MEAFKKSKSLIYLSILFVLQASVCRVSKKLLRKLSLSTTCWFYNGAAFHFALSERDLSVSANKTTRTRRMNKK